MDKLEVHQLVKKFHALYGTQNLMYSAQSPATRPKLASNESSLHCNILCL